MVKGCQDKKKYQEQIAKAFNRIYEEGNYARKIGAALCKRYSFEEARRIAEEVNQKYAEELIKLFHRKTCLYTTVENWNPENPVIPKIYNDLVDKFWDEDSGQWRDPKPGERQNAIVIFINDKEDQGHE